MSYILNALKKAETDRKREQSENLDDFVSAGWDPHQGTPERGASYKLAAFILIVAGLLFYGFYSLTTQRNIDTSARSELRQIPEAVSVAEKNMPQPVAPEKTTVIGNASTDPVAEMSSTREIQLPDITIAGHIYIRSGSAKNRIFIGDKIYYVGDRIDSDWVIEAINFDSLSIRSGTMSTELPLR